MQALDVAIAVILQQGRILVCQRRADAPLGGFWEFPGGKREPGETLEQAEEEIGISDWIDPETGQPGEVSFRLED